MQSLRLAYIRPTRRSRRATQERAVAVHNPSQTWLSDDQSPDDLIKMMARPGRVLIVSTLDALASDRAERIRVIDAVLAGGATILDAASGVEITHDCRDQVLAVLGMRSRDISPEDAKRAGQAGGGRGYAPEKLEEWSTMWKSTATNAEIEEASGIAYTTLWRWFTDRPIPVIRGRRAGRPPRST
jgi:hypothetical protein